MRKLLMIFFICLFYLSTACRDQEVHTLKLGKTEICMRDVLYLEPGKDVECVTNFIRGDYVSYSKILHSLVWCNFPPNSLNDYLEGKENPFKFLEACSTNKLEEFCMATSYLARSNEVVSFYICFYDDMVNDKSVYCEQQDLASIESILYSEAREFFPSYSTFYYLPYEMLVLRASYVYGNINLGESRLEQIEKFLEFDKFYKKYIRVRANPEIEIESKKHKYSLPDMIKHDDILLKMADDLLREIRESGGNLHEDFIRFKEAIDEGDLFKAIKFEPKE